MAESVNWSKLFLASDPFGIVASRDGDDIKWAGMHELRAKFEDILRESITSPRPQFVLNWGAYGAGKTHAAFFFSNPANLPATDQARVENVFSLYVQTPKEASDASVSFYVDVMEQLDLERSREIVAAEQERLGPEQSLKALQAITGSLDLARAVWLLGAGEDVDQLLLRSYLLARVSATQATKLGLARPLTSVRDRFRTLAALIRCFTGLKSTGGVPEHRRVVLWIDEAEDLNLFRAREYTPFSQALRELWDTVPSYLTIFMNFTLSESEVAPIQTVLGKAIMSRVTHNIYFREPNPDEAMEYVTDLLKEYRRDEAQMKQQGLPETYPFDEQAIRDLVSRLGLSTPREINKACRNVIMRAWGEGRFANGNAAPIDAAYVAAFPADDLLEELP